MKIIFKGLIVVAYLITILGGTISSAYAAAPTSVTASDGLWAGWVRVEWDSTYTAGFHSVWRDTSPSGSFDLRVALVTYDIKYYNDVTAEPGVTYYYKVKSCFDITCSPLSAYATGWRGYLNFVNNISASDLTYSAYTFINWSKVTNADYYTVFRSLTIGGTKTFVNKTDKTILLDTEVTPASSFIYHVLACNDTDINKCSEHYDYDEGRRAWPVVSNVLASDGGHPGFVRVTWDKVSGASSYRAYYSTTGGSAYLGYETATASVTGPRESYDYYLPIVAFEYTFAVTPCFSNSCGSIKSATDTGWLDFPAPSNVSASEGGIWTLVSWSEVDSNAWYYVYRDSVNSPTGKTLAGYVGAAETFADEYGKGGLPGVTYNYWVVACPDSTNSAIDPGCSSYSAPAAGYYLPPTVQNLTASDGTIQTHVLVSWDEVAGAPTYQIERSVNAFDDSPIWSDLDDRAKNPYQDISADENTSYYYRAKACGTDYCGLVSQFDRGYVQGVCYVLTPDTVGNGHIAISPTESLGCATGQYTKGHVIELVAEAEPTWGFDKWTHTDDDSITSVLNHVTMPANAHTVTATFSRNCNSLALYTQGNGTLIASPAFSKSCSVDSYVEGEFISVEATPDADWYVFGWTGTDDDSSTSTTNKYTMGSNGHSITVMFRSSKERIFMNGFED